MPPVQFDSEAITGAATAARKVMQLVKAVPTLDLFRDEIAEIAKQQNFISQLATANLTLDSFIKEIFEDADIFRHLSDVLDREKRGKIAAIWEAFVGDTDSHTLAPWAMADVLLHMLSSNTYAWAGFTDQLQLNAGKRTMNRHTIYHGLLQDDNIVIVAEPTRTVYPFCASAKSININMTILERCAVASVQP